MSDIYGSRLYLKLWGLKCGIFGTDPKYLYQKGLSRELFRVRQAFRSPDKIILTYTYGKVGSTAIHKAISDLSGYRSFQNHFISKEGVAEARRSRGEERDPVHVLQGEAVRREIQADSARPIKVITLVRDPVARAVSAVFQPPSIYSGDIRDVPLERMMDTILEVIPSSHAYTEKWFDRELSNLLGFDFFSRGFDREVGFDVTRQGRFELLSAKLENVAERGAGHIGRFLELGSDLPIPISNARAAKGNSAVYDMVKRKLKIPAGLLDEVYSSRMCGHFYTSAQLDGFRARWT